MLCRGVLVHCPSRLGATVTVLAAELPCGDRMFTNWTLESAKTVHHFDGVISHSFKSSRLSRYDSEPKLPSLLLARTQTRDIIRLPKTNRPGRIPATAKRSSISTRAFR